LADEQELPDGKPPSLLLEDLHASFLRNNLSHTLASKKKSDGYVEVDFYTPELADLNQHKFIGLIIGAVKGVANGIVSVVKFPFKAFSKSDKPLTPEEVIAKMNKEKEEKKK